MNAIDAHIPSLIAHLEQLDDPRAARGIRHELIDIVTISVLAVICGADTYALIHTFATSREQWLKRFLRLQGGIPSQDTFERVFQLLDPVAWQRLFQDWVDLLPLDTLPEGEREVVAIDGKTSRRSAVGGDPLLHTVSVYSVQHGMVLGAAAVPEKTNEITVIPELLSVIAPVGAIVTTDAMGCQKEIARQVREVPKADYLLALKGNHPRLEADVRWVFEYHDEQGWDSADHSHIQTTNRGHGRHEHRECWLLRDLSAIEQAGEWCDLGAVVRVRATRTVGDEVSVKDRFYLTSLKGEAAEALHASRLHWGVENSLHWVLDVVFGDDSARVRLKNARQNWVALRHLAVAVLRRDTSVKGSLSSKRYRAALDTRYLEHLLTLR